MKKSITVLQFFVCRICGLTTCGRSGCPYDYVLSYLDICHKIPGNYLHMITINRFLLSVDPKGLIICRPLLKYQLSIGGTYY